MNTLPLHFFFRPVLTVAPALLGCVLVRRYGSTVVAGRIVETEAYRQDDPASHTYRGRTQRNAVMFGPGGHLYVYFTYGMHFCANVVTGKAGHGEAVLLRAVEPLLGLDVMALRRFGQQRATRKADIIGLTRGPARLCQSFHLTREDNGLSVRDGDILITRPWNREAFRIRRTARIGIRHGRERRWRFCIDGNPWVSVDPPYSRDT